MFKWALKKAAFWFYGLGEVEAAMALAGVYGNLELFGTFGTLKNLWKARKQAHARRKEKG